MSRTELKISGMMCQACVGHVTKALQAVPGVTQVQVTLEPGRAVIESEGVDPQTLVAAVEEQEYEAEAAG